MLNPFSPEPILRQPHSVSTAIPLALYSIQAQLTLTVGPVIEGAEVHIREEVESIQKLAIIASTSPYYKYVSPPEFDLC